MSSISQFLPEPKHSASATSERQRSAEETRVATTTETQLPGYGHRQGWVPKTAQDFGDGGAYPEIHMLQYPRGLGLKREKKGNALAKQVDGDGNVSYDALARHGRRSNEVVHSQFKDMIPLRQRRDFGDSEDAIPDRPDADAVRETAERTKSALEKIVGGRISGAAKSTQAAKEPVYVRYTPGQQSEGFNSGARQRIVRVTEMPVDPMEPAKVRHQKRARAAAEPPVPVMHSPPRKLTAEEQREWVIPPCVSNWKNIHGFTVSLDKRLATDGRGMEETAVSDNFARLSEALVSAESHARAEIAERAQIRQALAQRDKEAKEERLRLLAQKAREERAANKEPEILQQQRETTPESYAPPPMDSPAKPDSRRLAAADYFTERRRSRSPGSGDERRRDELRRERRKQHERDLRLSRMGDSAKAKHLRGADARDISEKIALGIARPAGPREGLFDSRLFNQPSASNAALQNDEAYSLYDKPLFTTAGRAGYRPRASDEGSTQDVERLMASDRFGGALRSKDGAVAPKQPVEFEKGDVFGIGDFVDSTKKQQQQQQ
ncbi:SKIP/SNW domain-containing protein [Coemansia spiralis]|nr:SKIP/SNW domain-containing protein [Coemansia spiralis]